MAIPTPAIWYTAADVVTDGSNNVLSWPAHDGHGPELTPYWYPERPKATYQRPYATTTCPAVVFEPGSAVYASDDTNEVPVVDFADHMHVFARWLYADTVEPTFFVVNSAFAGIGDGTDIELGAAPPYDLGSTSERWVSESLIAYGGSGLDELSIETQFAMPLGEVVISEWEFTPAAYRNNGGPDEPILFQDTEGETVTGILSLFYLWIGAEDGAVLDVLAYDRVLSSAEVDQVIAHLNRNCGGRPPLRQKQRASGARWLPPLRQRQHGLAVSRRGGGRNA